MAPPRQFGTDDNLLDVRFDCPRCGQDPGGFWFRQAEGQDSPVTTRLGSPLPCPEPIAGECRLPAYSMCQNCLLYFRAAVVMEGRVLARLDMEDVESYSSGAAEPSAAGL